MKLAVSLLLIVGILTGCNGAEDSLDQAMKLREDLLAAERCTFEAAITADYGDELYSFQVDCSGNQDGNLQFTVLEPDTISGITGTISQDQASLTFDDQLLAFPKLSDGLISPVCAPWVFYNSLRGGYLVGSSSEPDGAFLYIDDSFGEDPLRLEVSLNADYIPVFVQIIWQNRRILSMEIQNFTIQ